MTNKNRKFGQHAKLKASDLIRRLPVHQQLDESQAALVKLSPIWQQWASKAIEDDKISKECYLNTELVGLTNGKLIINCSTAIFASQIKHQQQSILESILKMGFAAIEQIKVQLMLPTHQRSTPTIYQDRDSYADSVFTSEPVNSNSLNAIENCQKSVNNDQLANSLTRLAETLKKLNP